ncbi:uncharacterized protein PAC_01024 [Phialocephala subalpina]|uniref:Uncharacterized protein n=1 Tax=Phialocephala subalpina TaxID=576137 RepID=A0A1L7WEK0_9HELO|nr:uncharacterized protein PAC_01024 [Phialocephala subalpina]
MSSNNDTTPPNGSATQNRRGSFTSQTFNNIFGRSNSTSGGPTAPFPGPITTAAAQDQRRRMSITTLGLSGTSPTQNTPFAFGARRGSVSTAGSESFDENAIDDDEGPGRSQPTTPFTRRVSFGAQALRSVRGAGSPGTSGRTPSYTTSQLPTIPSGPRSSRSGSGSGSRGGGVTPPKVQTQASTQSKPRTASDNPFSARPGEGGGFNWSEQLRTRAESSVSQSQRPSFSTSPAKTPIHERAKSISEMPAPPTAVPAPAPAPVRPERKKPDAFQERILKGDFYMD